MSVKIASGRLVLGREQLFSRILAMKWTRGGAASILNLVCEMSHRPFGSFSIAIATILALAGCGESDPCADVTCSGHGECLEAGGEAVCYCHNGYAASGTECLATNACETGTHECDPHAACWDDPEEVGYVCTCNAGYTGDGFTCANVDECAEGRDDCDVNATCEDTIGSFTCTCNDGWVGDGTSCTDEDECTEGTYTCPADADCVNTIGGYECACDPGYTSDGTICKRNRVLLVGIDGLRPDALAAADTPILDYLSALGLHSDRAQAGDVTSCGPGWSSVLTGVWRDKHGVDDDGFAGSNFAGYPDFLSRIETARPSLATVWINSWPALANVGVNADTEINHDYAAGGDASVVADALDQLTNRDPDAMFVYFAMVEQAGLANGFHPTVGAYVNQIETVDAQIGQLLTALEARTTYSQEAWMILVVSDHGGGSSAATLTSHGNDAPGDRWVPFILYAPDAVAHGVRGTIFPAPTLIDVVPTLFAHLQIPVLATWQLDGRAIRVEETPPAAAFGQNLIYNPSAEASRGFSSLAIDGTTPGWLESGGASPVVYGGTDLPAITQVEPMPAGGPGRNLFAGGQAQGQVSSMTQVIDLRDLTLSGSPTFRLTGYVGGRADEEDAAAVTVRFRGDRGKAAFLWPDRGGAGVDELIIFEGAAFYRVEPDTQAVIGGSAQPIDTHWDCLWPSDVDAALFSEDGTRIYFFRGDRYLEYDPGTEACIDGEEKLIATAWPALSRFDGGARDLDAAFTWRTGPARTYFFKGEQYVRYDGGTVADHHPKYVSPLTWPGLHVWSSRIDAAAAGRDGEAVFFKQGWYLRYDETSQAALAGFPQRITATSWPGLGELYAGVRSAVLGPMTAEDRSNATSLIRTEVTGQLPVTTERIEVEVLFFAESGDSDGYVDELELEIDAE